MNAAVDSAFPVFGHFVVLFEDVDEVEDMAFVVVLNAKVVDAKTEFNRPHFMDEEAVGELRWVEAGFG